MSEKPPLIPKKSYKDGSVSISISLKCRAWHTGNSSAKIEASTEITTVQARELASALIEQADKADAKVAAKIKHEENRKKWRDREVASGRRIVMKGFFK